MITFQISSFVVYLFVVLCWVLPKKILKKNSIIFILLLFFTGLGIVLDFLSCYVISNNLYTVDIQETIIKAYMICLVVTAFFEFAYLIALTPDSKFKKLFFKFSYLAPIIDAVFIIILPIEIEFSNEAIKVYGGSASCAYCCAFVYFLFIIAVLIILRNRLNRWNRICFITAGVVWSAGTIIQLVQGRVGTLSIAFVCSLICVFIFVENPLNYIDHKYNCFKNNYIASYIDSICHSNKNGFLFVVNIQELNNKIYEASKKTYKFKLKIIKTFNKKPYTKTFINEDSDVFVICKNVAKFDEYRALLADIVEKEFEEFISKKNFKVNLVSCHDIKLFKHADEILSYVSIAKNKLSIIDGYYVVDEINEEEIEASKKDDQVKTEIVKALEEDRVEAFVQPIYSVEQGKIVSAEALCRIRNVDGTIMLPYQFIPISEKCGLDIPIGYRMIENVCKYLTDPIYSKLFYYVDVNLSIAQCEQANLASKIIGLVQKYGITPERINFEITESGYINKIGNIERNIRILTDYGFGFSLDDFGSGESNLDYLVKMPAKYLKLDMHMIWAYFENDRAKKTVQSIIKISHDMGLKVIAEGVESKEQLDELSKQGVDFVQGYYFFKPMPIGEYAEIANKN